MLAVTVICSLFGANSAYTAASERTREQGETSKEGWAQESVVYGAGVDSTEGTEEPVNRERATLEFVDAEYDLEKHVLMIDWVGENIASAKVYQDGLLLDTLEDTDLFLTELALEPSSTHTYKVTVYNARGEEGDSKEVQLLVDDYTARIENLNVWYEETTKALELNWDSMYTGHVDILLNDEEIAGNVKNGGYTFPCALQPGADYLVTVIPYNPGGEEGESQSETVSSGYFEVPEQPLLQVGSQPAVDEAGNYTGFYRPVVDVQIDAQEGAVYEVYRAEKNRRSAYSWIGSVKSGQDGICTYRDKTVGTGTYYYKALRKISADLYISKELYTGFSEPAKTVNLYQDTDLVFAQKYSYKVRAYYYDTATGKRSYGEASRVCNVRNTVGNLTAQAVTVSKDQVRVSWSKAANAEGYEVYYRTGTKGDSYKLLAVTTKQSLKTEVKGGRKYTFLIKAYRTEQGGRTYFSDAAVSCCTGFAAPQNLRIGRISYSLDAKSKLLIQRTRLKWDRVYGADGYYVEYYDEKTGRYRQLAELEKETATSYTLTGDDILKIASGVDDYYEAILTDPANPQAYLALNSYLGGDFLLTGEEGQQLIKLQTGLEQKGSGGFSKRVDVLDRLKEVDKAGYEEVAYRIGESFLFYYDVESDYDRYASAAKWFREAADSYLIAGIYCDISDCLELINQYNGAKIKQTEKMYEEYGKLWVMIGELKEKAGEFDSVDSKLQVWSEINTMIDTKAAQFLEITTKEELMELLKSISSEAGKVDKSIIREDMEELKDAIKETVRKLETAEEKEVQT